MINLSSFSYVLAAVLFILGIKKLSHPKTARDGNFLAAFGMLIAIVATLFFYSEINYQYIIAGMIIGAIIGATFLELAFFQLSPTSSKSQRDKF